MGAHALLVRMNAVEGGEAGLRRVLRGGAVTMAGAAVGAALNLVLIVAITRAFSQETAGLLFSATSVFLIAAATANMGTSDALVYFIARMRVLGSPRGLPALLRTAVTPAAAAACALAAVLLVFADPVADALGDGAAGVYLRLLAAFLPCAVLADAALAATRAHHDMAATVLVEKVGRPLAQLALVGAVAATGSAGLLALGWAGPYLPAAVLAWFWLGRIMRRAVAEERGTAGGRTAVGGTRAGGRTEEHRNAAGASGAPVAVGDDRTESAPEGGEGVDARTFWSFALPRALAAVAQMGVQRGGVVLVALLSGLTGAAVFTAATRVMVAGQFGTQAVLYAAQPRFAEQVAAEDHVGIRILYQAGTAWLVCLLWPLYLSVLVFAPEVMCLFGPDYATGAMALTVVCAGQLLASGLGMGDVILTMTGRTGLNLLNNVLSLTANVLLCVILVPLAGATGAALALVTAVTVRKALPLWQLRSRVVLHPFGRPLLVATASAVTWFCGLPLLTRAVLDGTIAAMATAVVIGAVGHLATVGRLRSLLGVPARR